MTTLRYASLLSLFPWLIAHALAQDPLREARTHYEAAAYEEALATLTRIDAAAVAPSDRVQVEQYRALCFIALDKLADAERAVAALVAADPTYVPSASVASPKVLSVMADVRSRTLPDVARTLMDEGRTAYQAGQFARAQRSFEIVLELLDDPALAARPEREDLQTLAEGFVTLITAAARSTPTAPKPGANEPTAKPAAASEALSSESDSPSNEAPAFDHPPVTEASPSVTTESRSADSAREFFVPAVAIDQQMPEWIPPTPTIAKFPYEGRLRIKIGADGRVKGAVIEDVSHPFYDARLVQVAGTWRYNPATRNGVPVESERVIVISLRTEK